jgi:hypothetical protein
LSEKLSLVYFNLNNINQKLIDLYALLLAMESISKSAVSALIAYSTHYVATKLYNKLCIPDGALGYLYGLIAAGSPVCQAGITIISNTQVTYSSMILMGITRSIVDMVTPGLVKTE